MKLEEAASILGVSLEDITIDGLKQTYKKLALAWDPEKCKDQNSKSKYLQISEAYKKLNSVMEGTDGYKGDDTHEIAAFMRMFMDMVGISESDSIPAAMTFGMMFGASQNAVEEWSTDEDGDGDYDDDDDDDDDEIDDEEDEEEYLPDEYFEEYAHPSSLLHGAAPVGSSMHEAMKGKLNSLPVAVAASWEPQVKQYSNMNLKDQLNQERMQMQNEVDDGSDNDNYGPEGGELTEQEKERKLKLAKKRAEKRKKQKEKDKKKSKEQQGASFAQGVDGEDDANNAAVDYAINIKDFLDDAELNPNDLKKLIRFHADHIITELMHAVTNGQVGRVNQILSYDFNEDVPAAVASVISLLREQLPSTPVLHHCITNLSRVNATAAQAQLEGASSSSSANVNSAAYNTAMFTALAARRLEVARYLLSFNQPAFELGTVDSAGLSVLHSAIVNGDLKIAQLVIKTISQQSSEERKGGQLNVNSRCHRQGWAPIHYAVERGDVEAVRLLVQNGANVQVTMATDKRQTPLELARMKLKSASAANKAGMQAVVEELLQAIEHSKALKEAANKAKKAEHESKLNGKKEKEGSKKQFEEKEKEKEKDVMKTAAPELVPEAVAEPVAAKLAQVAPGTDKKSKKKKDKDKSAPELTKAAPHPAKAAAPETSAPAPALAPTTAAKGGKAATGNADATAPVAAAPASAAKGKKNKKEKNAASATAAPLVAESQPINPIAEMSVSSRDEMVDRLLAMGFREADCLHAISLYGTDIDQAISWLCERPAVTTATPIPSAAVAGAGSKSEEVARPSDASPSAGGPMTLAAAMAAGAAMSSSPSAPGSAAKLQKEKEELRRINRAWNAKAEDEKRKAEALRKQAEVEKQQELLLQKQQQQEALRQQQAQQDYMYLQQHQQHQYMSQHQQHPHMQSHHQHQHQQAYYGNSGSHNWNAQHQQTQSYPTNAGSNNSSFPVGSLQHMATMLAAPGGQTGSSGASGSGFGAHPSISSSSSSSVAANTPSLQTLSGAMAMAMESSAPQLQRTGSSSLYGGSAGLSGGFPSSNMNSLGDAMGMSPYKAHGGGNNSNSNSSLLYKGSAALNDHPSSAGAWGVDSLGGDIYGAHDPQQHDVIVDGALELSAVAKPFVPRFGSAALGGSSLSSNAANALGSVSPLTGALTGPLHGSASPLTGPLSSAFGGPLSGSALGGLSLSSGLSSGLTGGLTGSPWGSSSSLNMDAVNSAADAQSNISSYLSNLLSSDLNLDEDNYEYGDASNIIPDLDSFLLNDN